jgi:hypothetical protein
MRNIVASKLARSEHWPTPKPVPSDLARVDAFALDFLPDQLAPWIDDIASRLQCPPDYPAITAMTALGAIVGRRIGIKPQMKTDWMEIPNIWGAFIGSPWHAQVAGNERGASIGFCIELVAARCKRARGRRPLVNTRRPG